MPIDRNTAQYITGNPQQPTQSSAPGIWDIDEQGSAQAAGRWPLPPNVVQRSLRFDETAYFTRTPTTAGDRRTYVWSGWVKRSVLGATNYALFGARPFSLSTPFTFLRFVSDALVFTDDGGASVSTASVYRDPSAWYHVVLAVDTTNGTPANTVRIYVNGVAATLSSPTYPATNAQTTINSTNINSIGVVTSGASSYVNQFPGYMAEVNFVDGYPTGYNQTTFASLNVATLFGQTDAQTGQWIPRVYSGSYGTNGFRLQFLDNSGTTATTLGKDTSGMGNNWTPSGSPGFSVAAGSGNDSLRDVPMNYYSPDNGLGGEVIGNYATFNPLSNPGNSTLTNGNLDVSTPNATAGRVLSTLGPSSGRWYCEFTVTNVGAGFRTGIVLNGFNDGDIIGKYANEYAYASDGNKYSNSVSASYGATYTTGDIIGVALDLESATTSLTFYKNGVSQGVAYTGMSGIFMFGVCDITGASGISSTANFGQRPFAYTAPSGFKALCTQNFSAPRIGNVAVAQANDYFNTVLYTGNGASSRSITGVGFQPDFVWVKSRTNSSGFNILSDAVRGAGRWLSSNSTGAEGGPGEFITSFDSDGFSVNLTPNNTVNENGGSYVAWCWNAGGSTVTNTSGSITSSVRANQTAGFSVVTYTGTSANATVGHGLGIAPNMVICKSRGTTGTNWGVWHSSLTSYAYYLLLNTTAGQATAANAMQALPSSALLSLGASSIFNDSAAMVAYCFAAVPGFSAFGSYTGNGSPDGPFVYLGFRPAFVLVKPSTVAYGWQIFDSKRNTENPTKSVLQPNLTNAESNWTNGIDFDSNGFKVRQSEGELNQGSQTYIYAAFAEIPFQFANAR